MYILTNFLKLSVLAIYLPTTLAAQTLEIHPQEGDSNHINYFKLVLSQVLSSDASVRYKTRDGTAKAGQDYIASSGIAVIPAGLKEVFLGVEIIGDSVAEQDESFDLVISEPTVANFPDKTKEFSARHTIMDDDTLITSSKLFSNGKIYTGNSQQEWAEAFYIENGVIKYIGDKSDTEKLISADTVQVDLGGKMVMAGIQDVHMHPLEAESLFASTCLLSNTEIDAEKFIAVLKACANEQLASDWVLGAGHSVFTLLEAQRLPIEILDEAIPDQPVVIMEETSHSVWVNSKALALAGIDRNTPNPIGGVIVKDKITGKPTGLLFDSAGDLIMNLVWLPTAEIKQLNYEGLLVALKKINSFGITSVAEGRTYWKRDFQAAWQQAESENKLTVRANLNLWAYPNDDDDSQIATLKSLYQNDFDSLLKISQIKLYSDGILINTTAAMLDDYIETLGEIPAKNGLNYFSESRIKRYINELDPIGFDFHIHAIGDRGVTESINAIAAAQSGKRRHRITHLEVVDSADYTRFKYYNISADMQVAGEFTQPEYWDENRALIGDRANNLIPLKSLYDAGARITLSSDWDVSSLNPFVGMQNALSRSPQNVPNLKAVIKAYTLNAAYVLNQEDKTGSLEVGKYADFIQLDRNIFDIPTSSLSKTKVLKTYLNGELVYQRD
jgi:predicted amidohydrolase YtcJ